MAVLFFEDFCNKILSVTTNLNKQKKDLDDSALLQGQSIKIEWFILLMYQRLYVWLRSSSLVL